MRDRALPPDVGRRPLAGSRPTGTPPLLRLADWFGQLENLRPRFGGGTGPFSRELVDRVEGLLRELFAEGRPDFLMHGDFHHFNILRSARGWLAIDPKGVIGPPEYEIGPFVINPPGPIPPESEAVRRTRRRIGIFAERAGFDRGRLGAWALCHALLSSHWDLDERGEGGELSRTWAEILLAAGIAQSPVRIAQSSARIA